MRKQWASGYWDDFLFGIHYLYWVGGCIDIDAGPGKCINIACNNDAFHEGFSGIWLCNDVSSILISPTIPESFPWKCC
jgi:hypothetical protein